MIDSASRSTQLTIRNPAAEPRCLYRLAGWGEPHGHAMIKTGLYRLEQLSSPAKIRGFFGGTRRVSITLYEKLHEMKKAEEWAEQILFSYCDARGIYKRTYACRFDQFDATARANVPREPHIDDARHRRERCSHGVRFLP